MLFLIRFIWLWTSSSSCWWTRLSVMQLTIPSTGFSFEVGNDFIQSQVAQIKSKFHIGSSLLATGGCQLTNQGVWQCWALCNLPFSDWGGKTDIIIYYILCTHPWIEEFLQPLCVVEWQLNSQRDHRISSMVSSCAVQYQAFGTTIQFLQSEVKNTPVKPPNREIPNLMINMFSVSVFFWKHNC